MTTCLSGYVDSQGDTIMDLGEHVTKCLGSAFGPNAVERFFKGCEQTGVLELYSEEAVFLANNFNLVDLLYDQGMLLIILSRFMEIDVKEAKPTFPPLRFNHYKLNEYVRLFLDVIHDMDAYLMSGDSVVDLYHIIEDLLRLYRHPVLSLMAVQLRLMWCSRLDVNIRMTTDWGHLQALFYGQDPEELLGSITDNVVEYEFCIAYCSDAYRALTMITLIKDNACEVVDVIDSSPYVRFDMTPFISTF